MYGAGIVTYNPDIRRLCENIEALTSQFNSIIIFDNHSQNIKEIKSLALNNSGIIVIEGEHNYGIGYALNSIVDFYAQKGVMWVLLLDQDSVIPNNLLQEYSKNIDDENVAIICPDIIDNNYNAEKQRKDIIEKIGICITSGSFINTAIWESVGKFREDFFIDAVDNEYCIRLFFLGYTVIRNNSVTLNHELGKRKKHLLKTTTNHNSMRRYFISRNSTYVAIKYYRIARKMSKTDYNKANIFLDKLISPKTNFRRQFQFIILVLLYEKDKAKKIKAIIKGTIDGIKKAKTDKLSNALEEYN